MQLPWGAATYNYDANGGLIEIALTLLPFFLAMNTDPYMSKAVKRTMEGLWRSVEA